MTRRSIKAATHWGMALCFAIGSSVLLPSELLAKPRGRLQNTSNRGVVASPGQDSNYCEVDADNGCYINAAQPIGTECECVDGQGNSYDGQIAE